MKKSILLIALMAISSISFAQKPKKTHDYNVFAKKINFSFTPEYIVNRLPDDKALQYIADKTGATLADLQKQRTENKNKIREELTPIKKLFPTHIYNNAEIVIIQESPIKIANIILNCTVSAGSVQFTLTNCVQTNLSWYLGDGVTVSGDGVAGTELANAEFEAEKERRNSTGFLGKMNQLGNLNDSLENLGAAEQKRMDSINQYRKGYIGQAFPKQGMEPEVNRYYQMDKIDIPLEGYYVKNDGSIVKANIVYRLPEFFVGDLANNFPLIIFQNPKTSKIDVWNAEKDPNFKEQISKNDIQAFYVGGQLFKNYAGVGWRIVMSEGAIHEFVSIVKIEKGDETIYHTFKQKQKLDGEAFGSFLGAPSTNVILDMMEDAPEIQQELKDGKSQYEVIIKYNYWFDLNYPEKVKYTPTL